MTTPRRTRRKPQDRAVAILISEQTRLEAKAAKTKAMWQAAEALAERGRRYIALLNQIPLPGLEATGEDTQEPAQDTHQDDASTPPEPSDVGRCPSCGGTSPWHYDTCTLVPTKEA